MTRTVWLVAFDPDPDGPNGVGGYDWYPDEADARARLVEHQQEDGYALSLYPALVDSRLSRDETTGVFMFEDHAAHAREYAQTRQPVDLS